VNNIIQQICENYISEILYFSGGSEIRKIDEIEKELKAKTDRYLRGMMKVYLEGIDEAKVKYIAAICSRLLAF